MPNYKITAIYPDDDGTAHVELDLDFDDSGKSEAVSLCGLDISTGDALLAGLVKYLAGLLPKEPVKPNLPADVESLIDQPQTVDIETLKKALNPPQSDPGVPVDPVVVGDG